MCCRKKKHFSILFNCDIDLKVKQTLRFILMKKHIHSSIQAFVCHSHWVGSGYKSFLFCFVFCCFALFFYYVLFCFVLFCFVLFLIKYLLTFRAQCGGVALPLLCLWPFWLPSSSPLLLLWLQAKRSWRAHPPSPSFPPISRMASLQLKAIKQKQT